VLTPRTFKCPQIVSRLYSVNVILRLPCVAGGSTGALSHRRLTEIAVGDALQYASFRCELCETAQFPGRWITRLKSGATHRREQFDTGSEDESRLESTGAGRFKVPPDSRAPARYKCVQRTPVGSPCWGSLLPGGVAAATPTEAASRRWLVFLRCLMARD
jgi:hypothetical protein